MLLRRSTPHNRGRRLDWKVYVGLCLFWLIQIVVISPRGEFPLNDDWVHTLSVYRYSVLGHWFYPHYLSANNLVPIYYGIILSKLFGFSFTLLRVSNLVLAFVASLSMYQIFRGRNLSIELSLLVMFLLWFNPLVFNLSYTFMGDIPALLLLLIAMLLYDRGLSDTNPWLIFLGSMVLIAGYFTRQFDILLYVAILPYAWKFRRDRKMYTAIAVPGLVGLAILFWGQDFRLTTDEGLSHFVFGGRAYILHVIFRSWDFLLLLSLFVLPITIAIVVRAFRSLLTPSLWTMIGIAALVFVAMRLIGHNFPNDNLMTFYGLGPTTGMQGTVPMWGPSLLYYVLHFIAAITAAINCYLWIHYWRARRTKASYLAFFALLYFLLIVSMTSFDRYLVLLIPVSLLTAGLMASFYGYNRIVLVSLIIPIAVYGAVGTYNYLSWNRVRWDLGRQLAAKGISSGDIEGGYEWDGWYLYHEPLDPALSASAEAPWYVKSLFSTHSLKFAISFSPLHGYETLHQEAVAGIASNVDTLYLEKRMP